MNDDSGEQQFAAARLVTITDLMRPYVVQWNLKFQGHECLTLPPPHLHGVEDLGGMECFFWYTQSSAPLYSFKMHLLDPSN